MKEDFGDDTVFNMGVDTIHRINFQLLISNNAFTTDNVNANIKAMKIVYAEMYPFMLRKKMEKQIEEQNEKMREVEKVYSSYLTYETNFYNLYNKCNVKYAPPRAIYDLLFSWRLIIERDLDSTGLLSKKEDDFLKPEESW